jgi:EmrB/QacA subfamily drug resistance transporter
MITAQLSPRDQTRGNRAATGWIAKLRDATPTTRVMVVAITVSMAPFLDGTMVNLALPAIQRDLGGGLSLQQWVVDGYLLALAAMILPGGSISDLFGRLPVLRFGLTAFGAGAILAAMASSPMMLISARVIEGLGGALLVPGSLAMINSTVDPAHRHAAIGTWTAWTGTAFALGPLLGGLAVDLLSWRWIYILSVIPIVIGFALTFWLRPMPGPAERARVDVPGAALSAAGLGAAVYALIESQRHGWLDPVVAASMIFGVAALVAFVAWERHTSRPMLPLGLFRIRDFAGANLATAFVYGALILGSLAVSLYLQEVAGYSATVAALITLPTPILSFLFAHRVGRMAARIGPRVFLVAGPALAGIGLLLIHPSAHGFNLLTDVLPGRIVLAAGLVATITPLTAVNLSSVDTAHSGIASAIQNCVGRLSTLIAVGCMGLIAAGTLTDASFERLLQVSAVLFFIGAVIGAVTITNRGVEAEPGLTAPPNHELT